MAPRINEGKCWQGSVEHDDDKTRSRGCYIPFDMDHKIDNGETSNLAVMEPGNFLQLCLMISGSKNRTGRGLKLSETQDLELGISEAQRHKQIFKCSYHSR